jgi:hypothetical protein
MYVSILGQHSADGQPIYLRPISISDPVCVVFLGQHGADGQRVERRRGERRAGGGVGGGPKC